MKTDMELFGFDAFDKALVNLIEVKFPEEVEKILFKIAEVLYNKARSKTPIGEEKKRKNQRLVNKWKIGKMKKKGDQWYIEVRNKAKTAHLLEDGHRMVTHDGREVGFVPGKKMLQISVNELEEELPDYLQDWLRKMLKELEL